MWWEDASIVENKVAELEKRPPLRGPASLWETSWFKMPSSWLSTAILKQSLSHGREMADCQRLQGLGDSKPTHSSLLGFSMTI